MSKEKCELCKKPSTEVKHHPNGSYTIKNKLTNGNSRNPKFRHPMMVCEDCLERAERRIHYGGGILIHKRFEVECKRRYESNEGKWCFCSYCTEDVLREWYKSVEIDLPVPRGGLE